MKSFRQVFLKSISMFSLKNNPKLSKEVKIKRDPEEANRFFKEGCQLQGQNDFEKAIFFYSKSLQKDDQNKQPCLNMGIAYAALNNHIKAITSIEDYLSFKPSDTLAQQYLGSSFQKIGNISKAIKCYHIALKNSPNNGLLYFNLATAYESEYAQNQNSSSIEKAILLYKKAYSLDPKMKEALNNLGSVHFQLGEYEKAINYFGEALKIDEKFANAYFNISLVHTNQEKHEEAIKSLEKAKILEPENGQIYYNLAFSYSKIGNIEKAKENIEISQKFISDQTQE